MRVRFDTTWPTLQSFLQQQDYPYPWTDEMLSRCLIASVQKDDGDIVGFIWFNWTFEPGIMDMHACIARDHKGRWITPDIVEDLLTFARLFNAKKVICMVPFPRYQRIMMKLGWSVVGHHAFFDIEENN